MTWIDLRGGGAVCAILAWVVMVPMAKLAGTYDPPKQWSDLTTEERGAAVEHRLARRAKRRRRSERREALRDRFCPGASARLCAAERARSERAQAERDHLQRLAEARLDREAEARQRVDRQRRDMAEASTVVTSWAAQRVRSEEIRWHGSQASVPRIEAELAREAIVTVSARLRAGASLDQAVAHATAEAERLLAEPPTTTRAGSLNRPRQASHSRRAKTTAKTVKLRAKAISTNVPRRPLRRRRTPLTCPRDLRRSPSSHGCTPRPSVPAGCSRRATTRAASPRCP